MAIFYIPSPPDSNTVVVEGQEAHHIVNVHRLQCGDVLDLFDKNSMQYSARIIHIAKKKVTLEILSQQAYQSSSPIKFCLIQSLVKSKKWDIILQKSMELGLENLIPMMSERVAAGVNTAGRKERWDKVLLAAAKQSERPYLLNISATQSFHDLVDNKDNSILLVAHTDSTLPSMHTILKKLPTDISHLSVMVGPEGGFSNREIEIMKEKNAIFFSLGNHILRAETAATVIIANIHFYFGHS